MSKPNLKLSEAVQKAKANEQFLKFLSKVSEGKRYQKLAKDEDAKKTCEEVIKLCWERSQEDKETIKGLQEEVVKLKKRLTDANLASIKQVSHLKQQAQKGENHDHFEEGDEEDKIEFYEPLMHLDESTRELVMSIVAEKMKKIMMGDAPPALLLEVQQIANAPAAGGGGEPSQEWKQMLEEAQERARVLEENAQEMSKKLVEFEGKVDELQKSLREKKEELLLAQSELKAAQEREKALQDQVNELASELASARDQIVQLEEEKKHLEEELAAMKVKVAQFEQEIETLKAEVANLQEQLKTVAAELEEWKQKAEELLLKVEELEEQMKGIKEELEMTKTALAEAKEAMAGLEARALAAEAAAAEALSKVAELEKRCEEFESLLAAAVARAEAAEAERDELKAELERRNNTKTASTQTTLTGTKIDELKDENKRQKTMLEELQLKLRELMEELGKKGLAADVAEICAKVGLEPIMKAKSCFQRLYDDANARMQRMEKLREKWAAHDAPHMERFIGRRELEAAIEKSTLERDVRQEERRLEEARHAQKVVRQSPPRVHIEEPHPEGLRNSPQPLRHWPTRQNVEEFHMEEVRNAPRPTDHGYPSKPVQPVRQSPLRLHADELANGIGAPISVRGTGQLHTTDQVQSNAQEYSRDWLPDHMALVPKDAAPRHPRKPRFESNHSAQELHAWSSAAKSPIEARALLGAAASPDHLFELPKPYGDKGAPLDFPSSSLGSHVGRSHLPLAPASPAAAPAAQGLTSSASLPQIRVVDGVALQGIPISQRMPVSESRLKRAEDRKPRQSP